MSTVYLADRIFTGEQWLVNHAVHINDGKITGISDASSLDTKEITAAFPGCFLTPAFIDLQIYGAYEKLFAVYPEPGSLYKLSAYCREGGAAFCMPTVATNTLPVFYSCIDAVRAYWQEGGAGILGLHIEGPWINAAKRGAHIESLIHSPSVEEAEALLKYGRDVIKIITLAPEVCSKAVIDLIQSYNIVISAGHSNATYDEAMSALSNGINAVTHLYNAMSPLQHRSPGLVGATFDHPTARASIIPDGHHVDFAAIRIARQIMKDRLFVITDAVTTTSAGHYPHELAGDKYISSGILSGSALNMIKALRNLVDHAATPLEEALRMCSLYPARVIGKDHELGKIAKGYSSSIAILSNDLEVKGLL